MADAPLVLPANMPWHIARRQQLAADLKEMAANPLDKTVPGGRYQGVDGKLHDAEGKPVGKSTGGATEATGEAGALADVELTPAAREKATEAGLTADDFKRRRASGASGDFTVEDVERIAEAKGKG